MTSKKLSKTEYDAKMHSKSAMNIFLCKIFGVLVQVIFNNNLRIKLARAMGIKIGKNVYLGKYCIIDDTFPEFIRIENNVVISFGSTITAHDASSNKISPVLIQEGAFIGTRSIILPGVTIGEKAIVGAGSLVTKDVETGAKVGGVPAKKLRS